MITISERARSKIQEFMKNENREGLALRFGVQGRHSGAFQYRLAFVEGSDRAAGDTVVNAGAFEVYIDAESAPLVGGTSIDFVEQAGTSGFKIENPNPLWSDPQALAVQRVLDQEINPAVASHGGWVDLLEVREGIVYLKLGGGCQGCGMVDVTLKQGIEVRLREVVPGIQEIIDATDHAGGRNPYYQPSKGGASPYGQ